MFMFILPCIWIAPSAWGRSKEGCLYRGPKPRVLDRFMNLPSLNKRRYFPLSPADALWKTALSDWEGGGRKESRRFVGDGPPPGNESVCWFLSWQVPRERTEPGDSKDAKRTIGLSSLVLRLLRQTLVMWGLSKLKLWNSFKSAALL